MAIKLSRVNIYMTMMVVHDNSFTELLSQSFMPKHDVSQALNLCQRPVDAVNASIRFLSAARVSLSGCLEVKAGWTSR